MAQFIKLTMRDETYFVNVDCISYARISRSCPPSKDRVAIKVHGEKGEFLIDESPEQFLGMLPDN